MADKDTLLADIAKLATQPAPSIVPSADPSPFGRGDSSAPGPNTLDLNDPAQRRNLIDVLKREAPAFIGGSLLSLAAPQVGVPGTIARLGLRPLTGAGLASTTARTALGGAGGEALAGLPSDIAALLTGGELPSPELRQGRLLESAVTEGGGELVGRLGIKGVQKVLAPLARAVPPQVATTVKFLRESRIGQRLQLRGPAFTPAEATKSALPDIMQNVADRFVLSQPIMESFRAQRKVDLLDGLVREITAEAGATLTPDQISRSIVDVARNNFNAAEAPARVAYNTIDQVLADRITQIPASPFVNAAGLPIRETRTVVEPALRIDFGAIRDNPAIADVLKKVESAGSDAKLGSGVFARFRRMGQKPTYLEAQEFATSLKADARELSATAGGETGVRRARMLLREVEQAIDSSLTAFDKANGTNLLATKQFADETLAKANSDFNPRVVKELINLINPNRAGHVESFTRTALGSPSEVRTLKKALGGPQSPGMDKVRAFVVQDVLQNRGRNFDLQLTSESLSRGLNSLGSTPSESRQILGEIFDGKSEILEAMEQLASALEIAEGRFVGKAGSLAVAFQTTSAFTGLLKLGQQTGSRGIGTFMRFTGGSVAAAKILTNKKTAKWLIEGIKLPANSEKGAAAVARLLAEAGRAGIDLQFEGVETETGDPSSLPTPSAPRGPTLGGGLGALLRGSPRQ